MIEGYELPDAHKRLKEAERLHAPEERAAIKERDEQQSKRRKYVRRLPKVV